MFKCCHWEIKRVVLAGLLLICSLLAAERIRLPANIAAVQIPVLQNLQNTELSQLNLACRTLLSYPDIDTLRDSLVIKCERLTGQRVGVSPVTPVGKLQLGWLYYDLQQLDEAIGIWRSIDKSDQYFALLGYSYYTKQKTEEASALFDISIRISDAFSPNKFPMYIARCVMLRDGGKLNDAERYCRFALEIAPSADNYLLLGRVYFEKGEYISAQSALSKSLELNAQPAALAWQGRTYAALGKSDEAFEFFERAIQMDPAYAWTYVYEGDAYVQLHEYDRARNSYEMAKQAGNPIAAAAAVIKLNNLQKRN
jgi:tetratricopeptide (TPR) repeat protein